jgi:hypothetical protein
VLEQLAVNSDTILAPLARDRARVASAIRNSSDVAKATAERRVALADDIETLPEFLEHEHRLVHDRLDVPASPAERQRRAVSIACRPLPPVPLRLGKID